jgi:hypothetical protein
MAGLEALHKAPVGHCLVLLVVECLLLLLCWRVMLQDVHLQWVVEAYSSNGQPRQYAHMLAWQLKSAQ